MPQGLDLELLREALSELIGTGADFTFQIGYEASGLSVDEVTNLLNAELHCLGYRALLHAEGTGRQLFEAGDSNSVDLGQEDARVAVYFCERLPA